MTAATAQRPPEGVAENETYKNVACPFCGLLCDDLTIQRSGTTLKVDAVSCPKAKAGFERVLEPATPTVNGASVDLAAAVKAAAEHIKASRLPLFSGLGTDADGIRAALSLAEKAKGAVDHALSEATFRNYRVLQTRGWMMSTLTEVRNRADLLIVVGSDIQAKHDRFFERVICADESLFATDGQKRDVVFIGEGLDASALTGPRIGSIMTLACPVDKAGDVVGAINAAVTGGQISGDAVAGVPVAAIHALVERIKAASYTVFTWVPSSLDFENADLTVHRVCDLVRELNKTQRAAGLSLGGDEGSQTASYAAGWHTGFPLRVSFASGKAVYDADRFSTTALLANGQADLLVWSAAISPTLSPPETSVPQVVIGTPGLKLASQPKVFIPVGTPGVDHAGRLIRCDTSVALPLKALGRSDLPSTHDVLSAIAVAL